ncbi:MAG: hypothetical protein AAGA87_05705 [Pseudomonadota bacterium]
MRDDVSAVSQDDPSVSDPTGSEAEIHLVRRTGAPPLRIRGQRVCHRSAGAVDEGIWIALWALSRSGFVVHCALPTSDGTQTIAAKAKNLDAAMAWLEEQCADLEGQEGPEGDLIAALHHQQFKWRVQVFLQLAGGAMADWPAKVRDR